MAERSSSPLLTIDSAGIAWITFADPDRRMNVLDESVMSRLDQHLDTLYAEAGSGRVKAAVILSGKADSFIAGADIEAIGALEGPGDGESKSRLGQRIYTRLARLPVPTVAAIHGLCLGGGLELALACRHRIATSDPGTRLGLPEVQLGLLPGWGGTTRLPRVMGLQDALDMLLTGKQLPARRARKKGLVDAVYPPEGFRESARQFASDAVEGRTPDAPGSSLVKRLLDGTGLGRRIVLATARKRVQKQTGGHYPAPTRILDLLAEGLGLPVEEMLPLEARAFGELTGTAVHRNLLHLFNLRERAKKVARAVPGAEPQKVERMGILGAGVMGGGIAQLAADNGIQVRMKDIREDAVAGGLRHARSLFDRQVKRRRMERRDADARLGRITGTLDYRGFDGLELVVEAVVERMDVKKAVLAEAETATRPECVLASNTSSLSITEMASELTHPGRFCGMHFFNPVHRMPLVEVIRGEATDENTLATVYALATRMGKVPVICDDGPGFLVNRILGPYLNEAGHLLTEGVAIEDVDRAATRFGMPMGPVRLLDEVGIDVARHVGEILHDAFGERMAPSPLLGRLEGGDRLGKKNGKGFYQYEDGKAGDVDASVYADVQLPAPGGQVRTRDEITTRLVLVMINEAARVLADGVVARAGDVDLGMIMGTGFPPFRGGLLRFADQEHPRAILERLWELEGSLGERFTPAPLLVELARDNRGFYDAFGGE